MSEVEGAEKIFFSYPVLLVWFSSFDLHENEIPCHSRTDGMKDDRYVYQQYCKLYSGLNILLCKIRKQCALFRASYLQLIVCVVCGGSSWLIMVQWGCCFRLLDANRMWWNTVWSVYITFSSLTQVDLVIQEKEQCVNVTRWFNHIQHYPGVRHHLPHIAILRNSIYSSRQHWDLTPPNWSHLNRHNPVCVLEWTLANDFIKCQSLS